MNEEKILSGLVSYFKDNISGVLITKAYDQSEQQEGSQIIIDCKSWKFTFPGTTKDADYSIDVIVRQWFSEDNSLSGFDNLCKKTQNTLNSLYASGTSGVFSTNVVGIIPEQSVKSIDETGIIQDYSLTIYQTND